MERGRRTWQVVSVVLAVVVVALVVALVLTAGADNGGNGGDGGGLEVPVVGAKTVNGVTRAPFGEAAPANAPGQELYLQQVTIAPHAKLAEHFHQGTQLARVTSGVLTYNIVSGAAAVTRANGKAETITGPNKVLLHPGDALVETSQLVHFGSNATDKPVVIVLAALLQQGAPLATTVGTGTTGTPLHLTADLVSQARTLQSVGPNGSVVYGWNRLTATGSLDGKPVPIDLLGSVNYKNGNGPFSGFITFSFADGSSLAVAIQGAATQRADGSSTVAATLGIIGGTGKYSTATGTGTFTGSRPSSVGAPIAATFDLTVAG